ncbi:hypothetical protein E2C01_076755 [Portunus trituberculatus]|uniref:Uncharacterized protein n=1 Tax=Portunus trituberculatus TaxID=210409 RepID=A0A5B7ICK8_PORTR|nr:hypothetical protein [Portunus trituberculatus]
MGEARGTGVGDARSSPKLPKGFQVSGTQIEQSQNGQGVLVVRTEDDPARPVLHILQLLLLSGAVSLTGLPGADGGPAKAVEEAQPLKRYRLTSPQSC